MSYYYTGSENQPATVSSRNVSPQNVSTNFANLPNPIVRYQTTSVTARIIKYLVIAVIIGAVTYFLSKGALTTKDIIIIALTAAVVFALLDIVSPTVTIC